MENTPLSFQQRKANFWKVYGFFILFHLIALFAINHSFSQLPLSPFAFYLIILGCLVSSVCHYFLGYQKFLKEAQQQPTLDKKIARWATAKLVLLMCLFLLNSAFFLAYQYLQNLYCLLPIPLLLLASLKLPMSWREAPTVLQFTREEYQEWQNIN